MTLETLTLTLNRGDADERQYSITQIDTIDLSSTKEAFSISPPGFAARENLLLGISGMQADITINWSIHDDGTDKSNGTASDQIITVEDQITYIEDIMQSPDFAASWDLTHETGDAFNQDEVFFESFDTPVISLDSPKWKDATMRLRRGSGESQ